MFVEQLWVGAGARLGPSGAWQRALKLLPVKTHHMAGYRVSFGPFSDFVEWEVLWARCWRNCILSLPYVCFPTFKIELIIQGSFYSAKLLWRSNKLREWSREQLQHSVVLAQTPPWGHRGESPLILHSQSRVGASVRWSQLPIVFHQSTYYCCNYTVVWWLH